ncbi:DUF6233 domain-containing protein [Streptomyces malaysiensis]|uniref:Uncharacterized protein n=1 Tax=Streptomyces malaysiensis TaxID=92644 RepID=A0A7X5XA92_STRMQ|nr:DUF6233 domain-containing protein [Streptomyces malaysiensis]NIY69508.1 hypothetical protein [Streptomyces malaysiensis]
MDAEEWRSKAGPWARAVLPDGQELDVIATGWTRSTDGQWWLEAEAILPTRFEDTEGRSRPTGAPTAITLAADQATPIPGKDYNTVPRDGAIAGRQWVLEKLHQYTDDDPARRLHRRDCWQAKGEHARVTTEDAIGLLAQQGVDICDVCRPDRALRR